MSRFKKTIYQTVSFYSVNYSGVYPVAIDLNVC